MTKRTLRYFFSFTDGQEKWLNEMAAKGWRLIKCGQLAYDFESCEPGEYEYAVEFVADKSYAKSKDYKAFLESMGYKTLYKNINIGFYIGKVTWRPWGEGAGQIATAPGSYQKELIIVEKKKDGKPFELHTDLTDSLATHKKIRTAYSWSAGGMFAVTLFLLLYTVWTTSVYIVLGAVLCAVIGFLWLIPALSVSKKIRRLKEEAETTEYEARSSKKKALGIITVIAVCILFCMGLFWITYAGGGTVSSGSALLLRGSSGRSHWNASYSKLSGYRQRTVSLSEGVHTFTVEITTESGELNLSITGKDGTEYYKGSELPTSTFNVQAEADGNTRLKLRIDAKSHSGSYKIRWD